MVHAQSAGSGVNTVGGFEGAHIRRGHQCMHRWQGQWCMNCRWVWRCACLAGSAVHAHSVESVLRDQSAGLAVNTVVGFGSARTVGGVRGGTVCRFSGAHRQLCQRCMHSRQFWQALHRQLVWQCAQNQWGQGCKCKWLGSGVSRVSGTGGVHKVNVVQRVPHSMASA